MMNTGKREYQDSELLRRLYDLAKRNPCANWQENNLIKSAAVRLSQLTGAWAYNWEETVQLAYEGRPAYLTGYVENNLEYDCWVLLYSEHGDPEDPVYATAGRDIYWTIERDNPTALLWSGIPSAGQIERRLAAKGGLSNENNAT